jgi:hypothetical protein
MSAVVAAPRARWIPAAWLALVAGWACLLLPVVRATPAIGLVLVALGLLLAVVAIVRGGMRAGIAPLLAALVVTPLVYFGVHRLQGDNAATASMAAATSTAATASNDATHPNTPAPGTTALPEPRPDSAMRTTITAVELSGAYSGGAAEGDKQFKGQRLLLAGMVDSLDPDAAGGPVVTFNAGDMAPVRALGLPRDAATSLRPGQQVILACNGAGAPGGIATVDGCTLAR